MLLRTRTKRGDSIMIRDMTIYDAPFRNYLANHPKVRRFVRTSRRFSVDETTAWYAERRRDKNCRLLIIEREGIAAGYTRVQRTGQDEIELHVIVNPEQQGKGVATAAVRAIVRHLRRTGRRKIFVRVQGKNAAALRMFRRAGFKESGEIVLDARR